MLDGRVFGHLRAHVAARRRDLGQRRVHIEFGQAGGQREQSAACAAIWLRDLTEERCSISSRRSSALRTSDSYSLSSGVM